MYQSFAFWISYFGNQKEEETKFAKKNIEVPISAFRSAEIGIQKNEKNKKAAKTFPASAFQMAERKGQKSRKVNCEHVTSYFRIPHSGEWKLERNK